MEPRTVVTLALAIWLICSLPLAVLIGYCALGEEQTLERTP